MMRTFFFDKILNMYLSNNRGNIALIRLSHTLSSCFETIIPVDRLYKAKGTIIVL